MEEGQESLGVEEEPPILADPIGSERSSGAAYGLEPNNHKPMGEEASGAEVGGIPASPSQ